MLGALLLLSFLSCWVYLLLVAPLLIMLGVLLVLLVIPLVMWSVPFVTPCQERISRAKHLTVYMLSFVLYHQYVYMFANGRLVDCS